MKTPDPKIFPFAEFDPILRRDLCAVLDAVQRQLGFADTAPSDTEAARHDHLKSRLVAHLREAAERGERCLERLRDGAINAAFADADAKTADGQK